MICSLSPQDTLTLLGEPCGPEGDELTQMRQLADLYDQRGAGCETSFKGDKGGLGLTTRNKKRFCAQEMLLGLSQLAHNVLMWAKGWLTPTTARAEVASATESAGVRQTPTPESHSPPLREDAATRHPVLRRYGIRRLVRDLFHISGCLLFSAEGQLCRILLNERSTLARGLLPAFQALLAPCQVAVCLGQT